MERELLVAEFERFVDEMEPRLRRAFIGCRGLDDAYDATAEALAYAWEHWERVTAMENAAGYLYRVGQSRTRRRLSPRGALPPAEQVSAPDVEPALIPALLDLPDKQRAAVWLVHGCQWRYSEVAEALGTSTTAVGTHVARALAKLRKRLEVDEIAER